MEIPERQQNRNNLKADFEVQVTAAVDSAQSINVVNCLCADDLIKLLL
jgi:hypothetical protein